MINCIHKLAHKQFPQQGFSEDASLLYHPSQSQFPNATEKNCSFCFSFHIFKIPTFLSFASS